MSIEGNVLAEKAVRYATLGAGQMCNRFVYNVIKNCGWDVSGLLYTDTFLPFELNESVDYTFGVRLETANTPIPAFTRGDIVVFYSHNLIESNSNHISHVMIALGPTTLIGTNNGSTFNPALLGCEQINISTQPINRSNIAVIRAISADRLIEYHRRHGVVRDLRPCCPILEVDTIFSKEDNGYEDK